MVSVIQEDIPISGATTLPGAPVLTASGIEKSYHRGIWPSRRRLDVLRGADLVLNPGEVVGLVGENGSGKSTLMKIIVGALGPDAGTVVHNGRLGYCPQEPVVYERLTCDEHFELFGHAYQMTPEVERRSRRELYTGLGPIFGRVSGVFIAFLVPFLDLGIGQSPMLRAEPPAWAHALPGYGPYRMLLDGGLTNHFDAMAPLLLGLTWLLALGAVATWLFSRSTQRVRRAT